MASKKYVSLEKLSLYDDKIKEVISGGDDAAFAEAQSVSADLGSHTSNTTVHITSTERSNWDAAKSHADSTHAPSNAEKNQNAFSNITVGSTTVAADSATDTLTFVGSNITITPDATNDKITFAVADGSTSGKGIVQLTNSTSSTSTTTAATPSSVKSAYDLANTAKTNAATAQSRADSAYSLAEGKADSLSDLGVTATAAELNYVDGVTSNIQTQLNGKSASSHNHSAATTSAAGFMSASDKTKLNGIATGANAYTHPTYTAKTGVPTANAALSFGGTFSVTQPVSDASGHITAMNSRTYTMPSDRLFTTLVPTGTSIPANADLNTTTYLKVGRYFCSSNANAQTLKNTPLSTAFMMEVFSPLSTTIDNETTGKWVYRLRKITSYSTGVQYIQYCSSGATANVWTYDSWYVVPRSPFALESDKNGGSAALGSATQPVYVTDNGTLAETTYTLGASVPSGAKFTDTTYSAATTSAAGLMSASDKSKLDGIATGANAYTLPTASSSTLGGVKTTSTVTSTTGLAACPIINGVPYYNSQYSPVAHDHVSGTIRPISITFQKPYSTFTHGGCIDFGYNNETITGDYSSRIIDNGAGLNLYSSDGYSGKILTSGHITALYNVGVTFSNGTATYTNSAIKSSSVCIVQRRSGTAGSATTSMYATTVGAGKLTIVTDNTAATNVNLNIFIFNL